MIHLNWHQSANFGDHLAWYIAGKLANDAIKTYKPDYSVDPPKFPIVTNYMLTGSIANHADRRTIIWGAGVAKATDTIPKCKDIPMIRGELSKAIAIKGGNKVGNVGDPTLLLPQLYKPSIGKLHKLGIIPHVVDYIGVATRHMHDNVHVIDLCQPIEDVIDEILSCETCLSSSLHGLITAHAYGIPCEWVKFSDNVVGDGFKFYDYFTSVGIPEHDVIDLSLGHIEIQIPNYEIKLNFNINDNPF